MPQSNVYNSLFESMQIAGRCRTRIWVMGCICSFSGAALLVCWVILLLIGDPEQMDSSDNAHLDISMKLEDHRGRNDIGPAGRPRSSPVGGLKFGDERALKRWLLDLPNEGRANDYNDLGRYCANAIASQGDYELVCEVLAQLDEPARSRLILTWVLGRQSPLGPDYDVREQLQITDLLRETMRGIAKERIYCSLGKRLDELETSELLREIKQVDFAAICRGAARNDFDSVVRAMSLNVPEESSHAGIRAGTRELLLRDSSRTGELLLAMEDGYIRDVAISETIDWLVGHSSFEEARFFVNKIQEPALREAARIRILENESR